MKDLVLPAFEMDCRDWLVVTPAEAGLPDEIAGAPLLAVLSTVALDGGEFVPASGVLTVGLLGDDLPLGQPLAPGAVAAELVGPDDDENALRYVLPAPNGVLGLLAEFTTPEGVEAGLLERVRSLMCSFRWAA